MAGAGDGIVWDEPAVRQLHGAWYAPLGAQAAELAIADIEALGRFRSGLVLGKVHHRRIIRSGEKGTARVIQRAGRGLLDHGRLSPLRHRGLCVRHRCRGGPRTTASCSAKVFARSTVCSRSCKPSDRTGMRRKLKARPPSGKLNASARLEKGGCGGVRESGNLREADDGGVGLCLGGSKRGRRPSTGIPVGLAGVPGSPRRANLIGWRVHGPWLRSAARLLLGEWHRRGDADGGVCRAPGGRRAR